MLSGVTSRPWPGPFGVGDGPAEGLVEDGFAELYIVVAEVVPVLHAALALVGLVLRQGLAIHRLEVAEVPVGDEAAGAQGIHFTGEAEQEAAQGLEGGGRVGAVLRLGVHQRVDGVDDDDDAVVALRAVGEEVAQEGGFVGIDGAAAVLSSRRSWPRMNSIWDWEFATSGRRRRPWGVCSASLPREARMQVPREASKVDRPTT